VDLTRGKLLAFAIGAAFAGATGTFYVAKLQTATPDMFASRSRPWFWSWSCWAAWAASGALCSAPSCLQVLQSWFLVDLSGWLHDLGEACIRRGCSGST